MEGGGSSSLRGEWGGDVEVAVVRTWMGRRMGEEVGGGSGVVRKGQLVRLVVRRGLKPVICVGLFGDDLGEIFGEFAINLNTKTVKLSPDLLSLITNLCLQLSSFSGAKLNCVGRLNCLNFAFTGSTSGNTNCSCCCSLPPPLSQGLILLPLLFIDARL